MTWIVNDDAAWHELSPNNYRHYSGVSLMQEGQLWRALDREGDLVSTHTSPLTAIGTLHGRGLWTLGQFDTFSRDYGNSRHTKSPVFSDKPMLFVFWAPTECDFPQFVKSTLARHFRGKSKCVHCLAEMSAFRTKRIFKFDAEKLERIYVVCECGCPIWQMSWDLYSPASKILEESRRSLNRKYSLAKAGGKHTPDEIQHILECQKGRCIYCHRLFTDELPPSKDHLLPVVAGGSDWALNIVLACRNCNSDRCDIPFRTYCTLLSPTQNKRILVNLVRRLESLELSITSTEAYRCFETALIGHQPRHPRYRMMKGRANRNVKSKRLLPRSSLAILRRYEELFR